MDKKTNYLFAFIPCGENPEDPTAEEVKEWDEEIEMYHTRMEVETGGWYCYGETDGIFYFGIPLGMKPSVRMKEWMENMFPEYECKEVDINDYKIFNKDNDAKWLMPRNQVMPVKSLSIK